MATTPEISSHQVPAQRSEKLTFDEYKARILQLEADFSAAEDDRNFLARVAAADELSALWDSDSELRQLLLEQRRIERESAVIPELGKTVSADIIN